MKDFEDALFELSLNKLDAAAKKYTDIDYKQLHILPSQASW
jgi:hypothetical protein